jgi:hypothetical protein
MSNDKIKKKIIKSISRKKKSKSNRVTQLTGYLGFKFRIT